MNQHKNEDTLAYFDEQVCNALVELMKKHLPMWLNSNKLNAQLLWTILIYASTRQITIEASCQALEGAPSANTVREHLREQLEDDEESLAKLEAILNESLHSGLPHAVKVKLQKNKYWEVAGDWVSIAYYGEVTEDEKIVRGSLPKDGTSHFYTYATLAVIRKNKRVTVALTLVKKGESNLEVVKRLLKMARKLRIKIKLSLWDKGFGSIEVMRYLKQSRVPYIIALAKRGENGIKRLCTDRRSRKCQYTFNSAKAGSYLTDVVIVCKYSKSKYKKKGVRYFCYAVYGIDGMSIKRIFQKYRRRFSIESGYRQLHQVRAITCMKSAAVRLLLVALAIQLVNIYVLLRRVVASRLRYGTRTRLLRLTLEQLARELEQYISRRLGLRKISVCRNSLLYCSIIS
jgi:putative transposase